MAGRADQFSESDTDTDSLRGPCADDRMPTPSANLRISPDERTRDAQPPMKAPLIPRRPKRDSAPLSFAQLQMWLMDQMTPGNVAYVLPAAYRLKGQLDPRALENSF